MSHPVKSQKPYGLWPSPVTPAMVSQRRRLENPQFTPDGATLLWLEGRSDRGVLVSQPAGEAPLDLNDQHSLRGSVGYGGGEYTAGPGVVIYAERDGRLYRRPLGFGSPTPITPPFGGVAAPALSPDGKWVVYVFSDGKTDLLGLVDAQGSEWPLQLAKGADFYMQPAWHPGGEHLAWVEWDHPNMPWDGTRLKLARLAGTPPRIAEETLVAGGGDEVVSQPQFSPDGRWLSYLLGSGEWEDLVLLDLQTGARHTLLRGEGFHLAEPAWVQGMRFHAWSPDSTRIYSIRNFAGQSGLWAVALNGAQPARIDTGAYTYIKDLSVSSTGEVAFVASAPTISDRIVRWDGERLQIAARSTAENVDPAYLANFRTISWTAPDGSQVFGLYAPPSNPRWQSPGLPPAFVQFHGGPTSASWARFSAEASYFTSRGYAWLEVNYRGSSGYGRAYRNALRERWGEIDVEDALGAAQALAQQGLADPTRLVIRGGSAGGYTVLNTLVRHPGVFKAGVNLFGVSNLFDLAADTHKFEERYLDSMVGPLPEAAARYQAWSPIYHVGNLSDPMAVFQGSVDKVVPPAQSEAIVAVLRQKGIPYIYRLYEGEGHGFRKSENIADMLQQTERFLQQQVLFAA